VPILLLSQLKRLAEGTIALDFSSLRTEITKGGQNSVIKSGEVFLDRRLSFLTIALLLLLSACASQSFDAIDMLERKGGEATILLLPTDIELSELTAGGTTEPNALWTEKAERHLSEQMLAYLQSHNITFKPVTARAKLSELPKSEQDIIKLHELVGLSILNHQYIPNLALPHKQGKFNWTLGNKVQTFSDKYGANYGLFVFIRDSYTSPGRTAVIVISALFGVSVPGGVQIGYASLVDLTTGEIVWFNRLARASGDLRSPETAKETIKLLLDGLPK